MKNNERVALEYMQLPKDNINSINRSEMILDVKVPTLATPLFSSVARQSHCLLPLYTLFVALTG